MTPEESKTVRDLIACFAPPSEPVPVLAGELDGFPVDVCSTAVIEFYKVSTETISAPDIRTFAGLVMSGVLPELVPDDLTLLEIVCGPLRGGDGDGGTL